MLVAVTLNNKKIKLTLKMLKILPIASSANLRLALSPYDVRTKVFSQGKRLKAPSLS